MLALFSCASIGTSMVSDTDAAFSRMDLNSSTFSERATRTPVLRPVAGEAADLNPEHFALSANAGPVAGNDTLQVIFRVGSDMDAGSASSCRRMPALD